MLKLLNDGRLRYLVICIVAVAIFFIWRWSQIDQDMHAIERNLQQLLSEVQKQPGETQLEGLASGRRAGRLLAAGAVLEYQPGRRIRYDAESFPVAFSGARSLFSRIEASMGQHRIEIHENRHQALSSARIRIRLETTSGQMETHQENFQFEWIKQDGQWLLNSAASHSTH